jgi:sugar phosphate isomerase/epimerase
MLDAWGPTTQLAHSLGVPLLVEHAHSLRADISFVHTLRDALDLARMARVGVLCELAACWAERGFAETFADGHELIRLVQVSDFVIGTKQTPDRAVPGDGDVPLRRLLQQIQATGYKQPFELELIGPRIEQEGYENAIRRALTELASMLEKVDADREPA